MTLTCPDAAALKTALAASAAEDKTWHAFVSSSLVDAVNFVNLPPAQGAGEFVFSNRPDGAVDVAYYL